MALHRDAGKKPAHVKKDVPGFIGNRLQHAMWREAVYLVENGICDAKTVDDVVKASFGRRSAVLGPLENADLVGTDLALAIHNLLFPRSRPPAAGLALSRETGEGRQARLQDRRGFPEMEPGGTGGATRQAARSSQSGAREGLSTTHGRHHHRHLLPHLSGSLFPGDDASVRRSSAISASGCAASPSCSISTRASRRWIRSATTGRSSRCPIRRSRTSPSPTPACSSRASPTTTWPSCAASIRERFPAFAAALCMTDVEGSVAEARRAVKDLGAAGVLIYTNVAGEPLTIRNSSRFSRPWPNSICRSGCIRSRTAAMPDYPAEKKSRFEMWWCLGWPYDTSVAMIAHGVLRPVRPPSEPQDHHAPSRRHDPLLRRPGRARPQGAGRSAPRTRIIRKSCRR